MRFVGVVLISLCTNLARGQAVERTVIVVLDGARYSETMGDSTRQNVPHLWSDLRPLGLFFPNFYNDGTTFTNSGHASILSGTWQSLANDGTEYPHAPTLFEQFRIFTGADTSSCAVVLGKTKLQVLFASDHPQAGPLYGAAVYRAVVDEYSDLESMATAKRVVADVRPRIMLVNLPETDHKGHQALWSEYVRAIAQADSLIHDLWLTLQADPVYAAKTLFVVTNDHGRHLDSIGGGFAGHGDGCEGCRHIFLLLLGPGIPASEIDSTHQQQIDIAPSVASVMGFPMPYAQGSVLPGVPTSISVSRGRMPQSTTLQPNYPNPFNPSTSIEYRLTVEGMVKANVVDVLGREVAALVNEFQNPGAYQLRWDAAGNPSGVYFCRLVTLDGVRTISMILLK